MTVWGSIISSMAHKRMKLRMRVWLPKDRTNRPRGKLPFGRFRRRFCGIRFHGVISIGATMTIQWLKQRGDYVAFKFQPLPRRHLR